jgi:hypothetical protein
MRYKNNTPNIIFYESQYSIRNISLNPDEEIDIDFYIDPSRSEFTLINDNNCIDPFILVNDYSLTTTSTVIEIPKPKLSSHYRITVTSDKNYSLGFNKDSFNKINLGSNNIYKNIIVWEYAPILILKSNDNATVNVLIEEIYCIV